MPLTLLLKTQRVVIVRLNFRSDMFLPEQNRILNIQILNFNFNNLKFDLLECIWSKFMQIRFCLVVDNVIRVGYVEKVKSHVHWNGWI